MNKKLNIRKILFSMQTAITLLLILIVACILGSVIPQGELEAYYTGYYPSKVGELILLLDLNDVFHCWWFVVLTICLCLNLLGCNLVRFPMLMRQMKQDYVAGHRLKNWNGEADVTLKSDPMPLFQALHFTKAERSRREDGSNVIYGVRNRIGIWGAWLTHLGMLIIIVGFALGQMFTQKYTVYGVQGETLAVEGTSYEVTIDRFQTILREDETVEQYVSDLTITNTQNGSTQSGETSVNHPMNAFGMKLYQNSTGWAAKVLVAKGEELRQSEILCAGEHLDIADLPDLVLAFNAFYPDFTNAGGTPRSASSQLNNPAYLYTLYYQGEILGMNVLMDKQPITVDDISIIFADPEQYTLIQLKRDPFTGITLIGGILILMALFLSFYMRTEELWAVQQEDGSWSVAGYSRKGGILFHERILEEAEKFNI